MTAPTSSTTTDSPSILDEHRTSPGLLLALLGQEAMHRLRAAHHAHKLKPRQFQILGLLHDHGGLAQSELMHEMGVAPSILVTLLNPLEADGLVARQRDPADRRRHLVTLTPAGEHQLASASRAQKDTEDTLFGSLDDEQRAQLRGLLLALRNGLAADADTVCGAGETAR
jgi:DNA-binding MarR family transcriptional regulator